MQCVRKQANEWADMLGYSWLGFLYVRTDDRHERMRRVHQKEHDTDQNETRKAGR